MPSPRPRLSKRKAFMPAAYVNWKNQFGLLWRHQRGATDFDSIAITFYISIPKSETKKFHREAHLAKHNRKPDLDNLIKSVMDAITEKDQQISDIWAQKRWIDGPGKIVIITCETLPLIDQEQIKQ